MIDNSPSTLRVFMLAATCLAVASPAFAEIRGCYDRVYDEAHMQAHPGQKVKRLRLQIGLETGPDASEADLNGMDFWLRGETKQRYGIPICRAGTKLLDCGMESDGGAFTLEETKDGVKLTNRYYLRADDPEAGEEAAVELSADAEHTVFLLPRISEGRCLD